VAENPVLTHEVVKAVAQETGRDAAQVVLRWALQHGQVKICPGSHGRAPQHSNVLLGAHATAMLRNASMFHNFMSTGALPLQAIVPRSSKRERIEANQQLDFVLSESQMRRIDSLDGSLLPQTE
jgi:diketogulonate reductase-like aldo/keto reductase